MSALSKNRVYMIGGINIFPHSPSFTTFYGVLHHVLLESFRLWHHQTPRLQTPRNGEKKAKSNSFRPKLNQLETRLEPAGNLIAFQDANKKSYLKFLNNN